MGIHVSSFVKSDSIRWKVNHESWIKYLVDGDVVPSFDLFRGAKCVGSLVENTKTTLIYSFADEFLVKACNNWKNWYELKVFLFFFSFHPIMSIWKAVRSQRGGSVTEKASFFYQDEAIVLELILLLFAVYCSICLWLRNHMCDVTY